MHHGDADVHVIEGRFLLGGAEHHVGDAGQVGGVQGGVLVAVLQLGNDGGVGVAQHVQLAGGEGSHLGGAVGDELDGDGVQIGLALTPVVVVLHVGDVGILHHLLHDEGAGAHRVDGGPVLAVGLKGCGAVDADLADGVHPGVGPLVVLDQHGVIIHGGVADRVDQVGLLAELDHLVEVPDHSLGVEVAAVGELDALLQLQRQGQGVGIGDEFLHQPALGVAGVLIAAAQRLDGGSGVVAVGGGGGPGQEEGVELKAQHGQVAAVHRLRSGLRQGGGDHRQQHRRCQHERQKLLHRVVSSFFSLRPGSARTLCVTLDG